MENTNIEPGQEAPDSAEASNVEVRDAGKKVTKQKIAWVAGGLAAALVAGGAAYATPKIIHHNLVNEYHGIVAEINDLNERTAEALTDADVALVTTAWDIDEATKFGDSLAAFGEVKAPVFPEDIAVTFAEQAEAFIDAIPVQELTDEKLSLLEEAHVRTEALLEESTEDAAEDEVSEPVTVEASQVIDAHIPIPFTPVADADVTTTARDDALAERDEAAERLADAQALRDDRSAVGTLVNELVAGEFEFLVTVGSNAPAYAEAVLKKAEKAKDTEAVTTTAEAAATASEAEESWDSVMNLTAELTAYVDAAQKALKQHSDQVAKDKAEAERKKAEQTAIDAGASGYVDPGTGVWTQPSGGQTWTQPGAGQTWTPAPSGGGSSGGGSTPPPATGGGGGTTTPPPSSGGGDGSTPPPATGGGNPYAGLPNGGCPAGTYPTGSWSTVGPGCANHGDLGW